MLLPPLELSNVCATVHVPDAPLSFKLVVSEKAMVLKLVSADEDSVALEFMVYKRSLVDRPSITLDPLSQNKFVILEVSFIHNSGGQHEAA